MKKILSIIFAFLFSLSSFAQNMVSLAEVCDAVIEKGMKYVVLEDYKGVVFTQGMAELAVSTGSEERLNDVVSIMKEFEAGKRRGYGSFISYYTGGNAVPELAWRGVEELRAVAKTTAAKMWNEQNRNRDGHMMPPWNLDRNPVFVDIVLTVTPYLLYSGLLENNQEYIDYAVWMVTSVWNILQDNESGLLHQARACKGHPEGYITRDCWSRGNGWYSMALASLLKDLPKSHPQRKTVEKIAKNFFSAVFKYQDVQGLWHQEMTWPQSYVEISGSALLLYGIGAALQADVLPKKYMRPYMNGLKGVMRYVDMEGNVANTCSGCLAYLNGTKADYDSHAYYTNEAHAFGPVLLAYAKAIELGIDKLALDFEPGVAFAGKIPACHVRCIKERKEDIAWENDRVAFRIYSREVKGKVSSGVDFWTKNVAHPVVEAWYALNDKGMDYHTDRGEGYDFYAVGRNRGVGGTGIMSVAGLVAPEPYANYRIYNDTPDLVDFEISYQPYEADGRMIYEKKRIRMVLSTHFYQVTSTIETSDGSDATLAVGLTDFGAAQVEKSAEKGKLSLIEKISDKDGSIGCAVFVDPFDVKGFAESGKDRLILLGVKSGEPVTYYVGAGWSKDTRFDPFSSKWPILVKGTTYDKLQTIYIATGYHLEKKK